MASKGIFVKAYKRLWCWLWNLRVNEKEKKKSHSGHTELSTNLYHFEGFWWQTKDLTFDWLCARFHGFPMNVKKDINSWLKKVFGVGFWCSWEINEIVIGRAVGTSHLSNLRKVVNLTEISITAIQICTYTIYINIK